MTPIGPIFPYNHVQILKDFRKMRKHKSPDLNPRNPVDRFLGEKSKRGRPRIARYLEVWGRAENYGLSLSQAWPELCEPLLKSERVEEVIKAFENHAQPHAQDFVPRVASDIFTLIKETKFPKRAKAQINYIAESVAGRPAVSLRTSRDICGKKHDGEVPKSPYKIIRKEFYIVCECGYKGPGKYDACRKCGAQISDLPEILFGSKPL
jgi:hypothetical protein